MEQKKILGHLYQLAYRAHTGVSFSPERRAENIVDTYGAELEADLAHFETEEGKVKYQKKYEEMLSYWLGAKSRVISVMITGASNFPTRRNEKANRSEDNRYQEFRRWRERVFKARERAKRVQVDPLEDVTKRLAAREQVQDMMKQVNRIIRKGKNVAEQLQAMGLDSETIGELLTPNFYGLGYPAFRLTNNLREIKRLRERKQVLEVKKQAADTVGSKEEEINGVQLVRNFEADRVQLLFPDKPSETARHILKRNAFKWSPRFGAWQRKLTPQAVAVAREVVEQIAKL